MREELFPSGVPLPSWPVKSFNDGCMGQEGRGTPKPCGVLHAEEIYEKGFVNARELDSSGSLEQIRHI